jgi:proline iminopeptidase
MNIFLASEQHLPRDGYVSVENAALYFREIGAGQPVIVLHGGPDFDHTYFLPELDRLSSFLRLIYHDQRGRGQSAQNVLPRDVSIESEVEDIERVRVFFGLESVVILGHSWGGVLALEYALRYPHRVTHLILLNTAPASHADYVLLREEMARMRAPEDLRELQARSATPAFRDGEPDAVAAYYRVHFRSTVKQPAQLDSIVQRLRASFTQEGIRKARAIEQRLYEQTWFSNDYDLLPALKHLSIPTLVLHGDYDFIPVECAAHITAAIPGARLVLLRDCGHFSFLECPEQVRQAILSFLPSS